MAVLPGRAAVAVAPSRVSAAPVTFVIPTLNEQAGIGRLLGLISTEFPDSQCVVVDGGSDDRTVEIAMPLCHALITSESGRAVQMNLGAQIAGGDYLLFLHADSMPTVSARELQVILTDSPLWGFCRVQLDGPERIYRVLEWAMNTRSRLTRVATGDQMLFVQRAEFIRLGGFASIPLMEDIELSKRLRRQQAPSIIAAPVITSSRRWRVRGVWRTVLDMWALRLAYVLGVSPQRLWQHYYGR
ncbi:MAG: TIGR04283 family arsenosugar biosynthesis glycosyltransferase [Halioglobus sp.]